MLRGVNKKIIEVIDTQNEYFERAILFLNDQKLGEEDALIKSNADEFLQQAGNKRLRRILRGRVVLEVCKLLCAAGIGALATLLGIIL